ncbi:MAG: hypothetical protein ACYTEQ_12440 [Planctomycetota bacterium]|jgi:hypothetical protein
MEVTGINPGHAYGWEKVHTKENEPEQTTQPQETSANVAESDGERGVIRLLQEGHFKGVADVRLRINFYDEISEIETSQTQAAAEEKVSAMLQSVAAVVQSFLTENELTEDQTAGLSQAQEDFTQAVNNADNGVDALTAAFEIFLQALQTLFAPPEPQEPPPPEEGGEEAAGQTTGEQTPPPPEQTPPPEEPPPAGPDWQTFIENLQTAFSAGMEELTSAILNAKTLPELSEPSGNGVAYDKFLAIYNQMRGIDHTPETLNETEPPEQPPPEPDA